VKYNQILEECLKNLTSLQRIRIKTDPKALHKEGRPENCPAYEGYILEEGLTKVKILVLPPDLSIEEIPTDLIEFIADKEKNDAFSDLKNYAIQKLNLQEGNPSICQLQSSNNIDELEVFLKQAGLDEQDIADLYGEFITT